MDNGSDYLFLKYGIISDGVYTVHVLKIIKQLNKFSQNWGGKS